MQQMKSYSYSQSRKDVFDVQEEGPATWQVEPFSLNLYLVFPVHFVNEA